MFGHLPVKPDRKAKFRATLAGLLPAVDRVCWQGAVANFALRLRFVLDGYLEICRWVLIR